MLTRLVLTILLVLPTIGHAQEAWEHPPVKLPANVRDWIYHEMNSNPGDRSGRTKSALRLEHIEVPLALAGEDIGEGLRPAIYESLVIEKPEGKFVRWIFNPEDTKYKQEAIDYVKEKTGSEPEVKKHFVGYLTASRSVLVQDPETNTVFSLKSSTNKTGGNWNDKKMTMKAAQFSRVFSDFISRNASNDTAKTFVPLPEPLAFNLAGANQAITVRDYPIFTDRKLRALPFFAAVGDQYGKKLAQRRGETAADYWSEHLARPWGRAFAEFTSHYGFYPNSAHTQDFLIERNRFGSPTGRIYVRDIMDSNGDKMIFETRQAYDVLDAYKDAKVLHLYTGILNPRIIPWNGMGKPKWIDNQKLGDAFYSAFKERFEEVTGIKSLPETARAEGGYGFNIEHDLSKDKQFQTWLKKLGKKSVPGKAKTCNGIFQVVR